MRLAVVGVGLLATAVLSAPLEALLWIAGAALVVSLLVVSVLLAATVLGRFGDDR